MAGYSGTPLPKKLGLHPGQRVTLVNVPPEVLRLLKTDLANCESTQGKGVARDLVMVFAKSCAELETEFDRAEALLSDAGMLWVGWPKKSSGVKTDLDEGSIRAIGLARRLVDVKVCAMTEKWSGLKFVRRLVDRSGNRKSVREPRQRSDPPR